MHTQRFASSTIAEKERLEGLLTRRIGTRIRGLRLVFAQTGVILRGRSETFHAKQVAQHALMELSETPILANEIEVK